MIDKRENGVLLFARNGANRPVHQDRQVLRAEDLRLEQATQDQMLARARRYLHGWGVVSGLIPESENRTGLAISPGYGITPLGDEIFLPDEVIIEGVAASVIRHCGIGGPGCDVFDPSERMEALRHAEQEVVTSFLIARPASHEASPRSGVPQDCAHPAAQLLPSRRCGGVEFAIICSLPQSHQPPEQDCGLLTQIICGGEEGLLPVPWATPAGPENNFIVLARLTATRAEVNVILGSARRRLLPVSVMQDWITSCLCPVVDRPRRLEPAEPVEPPVRPPITRPPVVDIPDIVLEPVRPPRVPPVVDPPRPIDVIIRDIPILPTIPIGDPPREVDIGPVINPDPVVIGPNIRDVITSPEVDEVLVNPGVNEVVTPNVRDVTPVIRDVVTPNVRDAVVTNPRETPTLDIVEPTNIANPDIAVLHIEDRATGAPVELPTEFVVGIRDRLTNTVTSVGGIGPARANTLANIGVTTEGDFLTAPTSRLASTLRVTETKVNEMKDEVNVRRNLNLVFR